MFGSWNNDRAVAYRRINNIPGDWGTAVTVQSMVFGNLGADCATGVAFTRDPATGEKGIYGEFLPNAQGEDVVAGIRTPHPISLAAGRKAARRSGIGEEQRRGKIATLEEIFPRLYRDLLKISAPPRAPLPRHPGHGIHHRAREALHAPDPHRQAHRRGRGADRRRHGGREAHRPPRRPDAGGAGAARAIAASAPGSHGQEKRDRARPAGLARRGFRRGRVFRRRGGRSGAGGPQGHPRAHRNLARGHPGHAGRRGNPDRARRHDQPRGGGRARDGQVLRRRMLRVAARLQRRHAHRARHRRAPRRVPHAGRHHRRSDRGAGSHRRSGDDRRVQEVHDVGRPGAHAGGARQCRHAARRQSGARLRRRGHRPLPHRAHVLRPRGGSTRCAK